MTPLCDNRMGNGRRFMSRRDFWFKAGMGIGGLAIMDLLNRDGLLAAEPPKGIEACLGSEGVEDSPYLPKPPHFEPRAKSVIHLFMSGGVSQVDTFDYKPDLGKYHGVALAGKGEIRVRQGYPGPLMKSPFTFKQYGESGTWVSEIFPHMSTIVDDLAFIHSAMHQDRERMTRRIIKAMENPHVDILGHPTARVIGERPAVDVDMEAVLDAARRTGTAIEINASPHRLDLRDVWVRRATELGAPLVISSDSHATAHLSGLRFGVNVARRGMGQRRME